MSNISLDDVYDSLTFKELGTLEDINVLLSTNEYKLVSTKSKLLWGRCLYFCKTHKGFYLVNAVLDYLRYCIGYVHYTMEGVAEERVTDISILSDILKKEDTFQKYDNVYLDRESHKVVVTENGSIACIVGTDSGFVIEDGEFYDVEQNDKYILVHCSNGATLLIAKSDYSSAWTSLRIGLESIK